MFAVGLEELLNESAIRLRIRQGCTLGRSEDGRALILETDNGRVVRLSDYVSHYDAAIAGIASGTTLSALRDSVVASGGEWHAITFLDQVGVLCRTGFVEYPLVEDGTQHAVIVPQWASFVPSLASRTPPIEDRLQRFACVRRSGDAWLVESPLCGARLVLADLSALDAPLVRRALAAAGFLQEARAENDSRQEALKLWEFQDLLFHTHQRRGWHRDMLGAGFPFVGEIDPPPAERPSWPGERIELPRAAVDSGREAFASVLERRRTVRRFDDSSPISVRELGALLDRSARIRSARVVPVASPSGQSALFEITKRPYPSAGACHELEIYPVVARVPVWRAACTTTMLRIIRWCAYPPAMPTYPGSLRTQNGRQAMRPILRSSLRSRPGLRGSCGSTGQSDMETSSVTPASCIRPSIWQRPNLDSPHAESALAIPPCSPASPA